jgi:stearoyl-CoA desaturase (Delta-9 desaturase)
MPVQIQLASSPSELDQIASFWYEIYCKGRGVLLDVADHDKRELRDPVVSRVDRFYKLCVIVGVLIPALIGVVVWGGAEGALLGAFWGGFARIAAGQHIIWSINSVCHVIGTRHHESADGSGNVPLIAVISFGEGWHNNHHKFPTSARLDLSHWQLDLGWVMISALRRFGLVDGVKEPLRQ